MEHKILNATLLEATAIYQYLSYLSRLVWNELGTELKLQWGWSIDSCYILRLFITSTVHAILQQPQCFKCDALQKNREQVAQAYLEMWTIEVGIWVKNNSSVDFDIFIFTHIP